MNYFSMYAKKIPLYNNYFIVSVKVLYDNMFCNVSEKILICCTSMKPVYSVILIILHAHNVLSRTLTTKC